jgi:hypothetical protein
MSENRRVKQILMGGAWGVGLERGKEVEKVMGG